MIIFYNKTTGDIVGTIDGRIHNAEHLGMTIGDSSENDKIVIQWKPVIFYDEKGKVVPKGSKRMYTADFEPEAQKDLIMMFEKTPSEVYTYKVDLTTKQLVKK